MRRPLPISRGLVFALFFLVPASGAFAAEAGTLRAGAAKSEITPAAGTPLSGYGKLRGKKTRGTHDPLFARSLAFSRGDKTFLITSLDLCLVDEELRAAVLRKIHEKRPLAPENFVLTATHTHSGAGAVGGRFWERFIMGKFEKKVFEALTSAAAESGVAALDAEVPVRAEYAQLRIDDLVENRMIPKLRYPQSLKILRFKDGKDAVAGQLLFMAAHPTVFPAKEKMEFSADYPGVLAAALEEKTGGAVSVFVNGAAGDLRPHLPDGDDKLSKMTAYGRALAEKTAAASFSPAGLEGPWEAVLERVKLPRTQVRISGPFKIPSLIGNRFFPRKTFFQGLRLGDFVLLTFPGEITSEIGHEIEAQAAESGLRPLLAGYANDYLAYVVPRRYYRDMEQYESRVSFYGKDMAWFAQKKMLAIADKLLTAEEKAAMEAPGTLEWQGELPVLLLHGSAYHQGFEEGRLMKDKIHSGVDGIFGYFRGQIPVPLVNRLIIRSIGNRAWKKMEPYVSYEEYETIRGLSDGSGVSLGTMKRIHALPELFPALCTNGAYWGKATADGRLIALRNLDWNREMGVHKLAAIKFHDSRGREDFVNIGYAGFSGVLSGMNEAGLSIGQIGASSADETMQGVPMPFLMRRLMMEARSLDDAKAVFERSDLTRGYNYVIADAVKKEALVVEATRSHVAFFRDDDPKEKEAAYAFTLPQAVFRGDPALDPTIRELQTASGGEPEKPGLEPPTGSAYEIRYLKHGHLVQENYGKITTETAQSIAHELAPKSNIQSVVYEFPEFCVANAEGDKRAVDSGYYHFNFEELEARASSAS